MAYLDTVKTAQDKQAEFDAVDQNDFDQEARDAAAAADVTRSEYVNYETKLSNYATRSDIEPLAERRARDIGLVPEQTFRRKGEGSIAVFTSPGDQNVAGWDGTPSDADGAADAYVAG